ncbi:hypothetical protein C8R43DRAFT_950665 [Mycena crocata]|nr:hypothetical protein C8R43DRAFT_950665 [Mycena crocata]
MQFNKNIHDRGKAEVQTLDIARSRGNIHAGDVWRGYSHDPHKREYDHIHIHGYGRRTGSHFYVLFIRCHPRPGVEPVITEEQLWKGLEYKAHNPADFVPLISRSKTISDEGKKLVRQLTPLNSTEVSKENVEFNAATIMSTGFRVTNTVSYGPSNEMLLTYSFVNFLGLLPTSQNLVQMNAIVGKALVRGIGIFRQMVKESCKFVGNSIVG